MSQNNTGVKIGRVILIVIDSVGAGELPDAAKYGDTGSNTLGNTAKAVGGLMLPNLEKMGLGNIIEIKGVGQHKAPTAFWGKMAEVSAGKDTTSGHWEIMGLHLDTPFPTYPDGFPPDVIEKFEHAIGRKVIGNIPASGTGIIDELGPRQMQTGELIVYTSADSVFQIAAHEETISIDDLYRYCEIAREILSGEHSVGRVIARPYVGKPGNFERTHRRRDYSVKPTGKTVLDFLKDAGLAVFGVGKIYEIFAGQGLTGQIHTESNAHGIEETLKAMDVVDRGLIFTNLVDFDSKWGHRNDAEGYAKGLEYFDSRVPEIIERLCSDDVLVVTADHGCDPTTSSTDHSREYVPLIVFGKELCSPKTLGVRKQFSDLGKTVADLLGVDAPVSGESFSNELI
jgi:phosphopentomutase